MEVTQDGLAFITSGMDYSSNSEKYHSFIREKNIRGTIFLYDFKNPKLGASALRFQPSKTFDPATFQPHGISLLEDKAKGEHLLYVVNHVRHGKDRVEKFKFIPRVNELQHLRSFNDSTFLTLNDVAVISEDKFYASNFLFFESHFLSVFEHLLPIPLGGLLLVDGNHVTEVVKSLHGPNGVTLSKDKRYLYAAIFLEGTMHVYETQKDYGLKLVQNVPEVHTGLDNLQKTQSGDALLAGAHPIPYKMLAHLGIIDTRAPSSVIRLPLSDGLVDHEKITELFYDHGDLISGSSVAHIHSGQLLIGSVIDKLVVCDLYGKVTGKKASNV
ncbi:serum paraoxonase/arylesterase 2-like [Plakobranchus ocellatus]|uniref:Paraoxonase n=1 Tax=Plakobranchus ocellatus TaxID=259542 RepID=A0AAV3YWW9_9GAST|nr:serum paraoxonase/arylesterase 2-like [Plakobranchus ocellatus]